MNNYIETTDMTAVRPSIHFRSGALHFVAPGGRGPTGPQTLTQTVCAGVEKVDERALQPVAAGRASPAFQPKFMLALLTYSYARQIYGSKAVERLMAGDPAFCEVCQNEFPSARMISQFRNDNRQSIRACLIDALTFLARQKMGAGIVTRIKEAWIAEDANRRLITAMCIDSADLERGQCSFTS